MDDHGGSAPGHARPVVVRLPEEVAYSNARQVREELASALAAGATVIADLTSTTFCDTAGLQEVVAAHKAAAATGSSLRVVVPLPLARLFTLTGLDQVLGCTRASTQRWPPGTSCREDQAGGDSAAGPGLRDLALPHVPSLARLRRELPGARMISFWAAARGTPQPWRALATVVVSGNNVPSGVPGTGPGIAWPSWR